MAKQNRKLSLVEALANTLFGFIFSLCVQLALNFFYDVEMSFAVASQYTIWFTVASVTRSYVLRRLFNRLQ